MVVFGMVISIVPVVFMNELVQGHGHGRRLGTGCTNVKPEAGIKNGFLGGWSEGANAGVVLNKTGKVCLKRLNTGRTEKHKDIIIRKIDVRQVAAYRLVHYRRGIFDLAFIKHSGDIRIMNIRQRNKVLFVFVLVNDVHKLIKSVCPVKYLPFAVDNIFLQVVCNRLGNAEILHGIGHLDPEFLTQPEIMINGGTAGKNYGRMRKNINPVLPEIFRSHSFNMNKRPEINTKFVLFCQVAVR